jgi:hypothetical protein
MWLYTAVQCGAHLQSVNLTSSLESGRVISRLPDPASAHAGFPLEKWARACFYKTLRNTLIVVEQ